jgi:RimJ/RimL family protein N-acetyltransferase
LNARIPERIESGHLAYERVSLEHGDALTQLMRDPRVMRTLWPWSTVPSEEQIRSSLDGKVAHWMHHGFGMWALFDRSSHQFVGRGGLQYTDVLGARSVEAGWAIVPERWGEGLATELALTCVDVGFSDLGLRDLIAFTLPDNIASRRVMEKAGFVYEREITHAGLPHVLYRVRPPQGAKPAAPAARLVDTSRPPL